ncbi:hypothetical protein EV127DRAFT_429657 [Xylaria flabelliformis]|nr:hypothetical protein EV127DRAFT_429657 [Xylaria flabelliformis]
MSIEIDFASAKVRLRRRHVILGMSEGTGLDESTCAAYVKTWYKALFDRCIMDALKEERISEDFVSFNCEKSAWVMALEGLHLKIENHPWIFGESPPFWKDGETECVAYTEYRQAHLLQSRDSNTKAKATQPPSTQKNDGKKPEPVAQPPTQEAESKKPEHIALAIRQAPNSVPHEAPKGNTSTGTPTTEAQSVTSHDSEGQNWSDMQNIDDLDEIEDTDLLPELRAVLTKTKADYEANKAKEEASRPVFPTVRAKRTVYFPGGGSYQFEGASITGVNCPDSLYKSAQWGKITARGRGSKGAKRSQHLPKVFNLKTPGKRAVVSTQEPFEILIWDASKVIGSQGSIIKEAAEMKGAGLIKLSVRPALPNPWDVKECLSIDLTPQGESSVVNNRRTDDLTKAIDTTWWLMLRYMRDCIKVLSKGKTNFEILSDHFKASLANLTSVEKQVSGDVVMQTDMQVLDDAMETLSNHRNALRMNEDREEATDILRQWIEQFLNAYKTNTEIWILAQCVDYAQKFAEMNPSIITRTQARELIQAVLKEQRGSYLSARFNTKALAQDRVSIVKAALPRRRPPRRQQLRRQPPRL